MSLTVKKFVYTIGFVFALCHVAVSQDLTRELNIGTGGSVEIVNKYGRVAARAESVSAGQFAASRVVASSPKGVLESEIKISNVAGHVVMTVAASDPRKRIDIVLTLPERTHIKVETSAGAIDVGGNFASIDAKTDTGTVSARSPGDNGPALLPPWPAQA